MQWNQGPVRFLARQFKRYWYYYLSAFVFLALTHWVQSLLPFWAKELADLVGGVRKEISTAKFFYVAVGIIIFRTAGRLLFFTPARFMERDLRFELLKKVESVIPWRYQKWPIGQIYQIIYNDCEQMRALVGFAFLQIGNIIIASFVLLPKMHGFHPSLIYSLIPLLVGFFLFLVIVGKTRHHYKYGQETQGNLNNFLMEVYRGKVSIRNFQQEKSFVSEFSGLSYKELWHFYRAGLGVSFSMPLIPLGVGLSLCFGAFLAHYYQLGANTLIIFSGFIFLFLEPLMYLSWIGVVFVASMASWKRIEGLGNDLETVSKLEHRLLQVNKELFSNQVPPAFGSTLELKLDFWKNIIPFPYRYQPRHWPIFLGETGSGKTYLLEQLAYCLEKVGIPVGLVGQDPPLYNDSIENNIFLGKKANETDRKLAYELIQMFGLDELGSHGEKLWDLQVGENGKHLSGGQAKRLALVRSLMAETKVLLWDDPFSSVDVLWEKKIFEDLKNHPLMQQKTLVLTGHRLTTARQCQEMILVEKEKGIIASGGSEMLENKTSKIYEHFKEQMV